MEILSQSKGRVVTVQLKGRLDAFGANELQDSLSNIVKENVLCVIFDLSELGYISSAGLRVLLMVYKSLKAKSGGLVLANIQGYCREVLEMTGFASSFQEFKDIASAEDYCEKLIRENYFTANWENLESLETTSGVFKIMPVSEKTCDVYVLGDVKQVLFAQVKPENICAKRFFETEYSIGLGGLGHELNDYYPIMGEMITMGGSMVWLPTDGHDTPDFLIPKTDSHTVHIHTAFNVSLSGNFNEYILFKSSDPDGITIDELYQELFKQARDRKNSYHGVIGLAMLADMNEVYGSGVKKSPISDFSPANEKMIMHKSNIEEWLDCDESPRYRDVTCLIGGIGASLDDDLSDFNDDLMNKVFYLHPANIGAQKSLLHNHAIVFDSMPFPEKATDFEKEMKSVIEKGNFKDMRHLLDTSKVRQALIGICYIDDFEKDPSMLDPKEMDGLRHQVHHSKNKLKSYQKHSG